MAVLFYVVAIAFVAYLGYRYLLNDNVRSDLEHMYPKLSEEDRAKKNQLDRAINSALADGRVTDEELEELKRIELELGVQANISEQKSLEIRIANLLHKIETAPLTFDNDVPIQLQKGENCYWHSEDVVMSELRQVTQRVNYGGITARVKIVKGVYYRAGSIGAQTIKRDEWVNLDVGTLYVTNKRFIYTGSRGVKAYKLDQIVSFIPYKDAVEIHMPNKKPITFQIGIAEAVSIIYSRLLNEVNVA